MGHGAWGMEQGAWSRGHGARGMGICECEKITVTLIDIQKDRRVCRNFDLWI